MTEDKDLNGLSDINRQFLTINDEIIELNREIKKSVSLSDNQNCLNDFENKLIEWRKMTLDYLTKDGYVDKEKDDKWVFEIDMKVIEIMLTNLRNQEEEPILHLLIDKQRIHIKCLPVPFDDGKFGMRFWCPLCEEWHEHGIGEGHRVAHCKRDFTRAGESLKRSNPLRERGYVIRMMSKDELIAIRDDINAYCER